MKKNKSIIFGIFLFVTILIVSLVISVCAAEKTIILSLAEFNPPESESGRQSIIFQEELAEKTGGKVNLKIYWAGSLLGGKEILRGVQDGVADMGSINPNYYPNQLPISGVFNVIPKGPVKYESQIMVYEKVNEKVLAWEQEFLSHNQIPLYKYALSDKAICSTKPIASLKDFENQKMRAASRWLLDMMSAVGATPVSVPWADCYMALQTGTIDAVLTNLGSIHYAKLDEVAQNILLLPGLWAKPACFYTINTDVWNGLSEEIQGQFEEALEVAYTRYGKLYEEEWSTVVRETKEMGSIVNSMSKQDMEEWVSLPVVDKMQAQWIKEMEEQGSDKAQLEKILEEMKVIVEEVVKIEEQNN